MNAWDVILAVLMASMAGGLYMFFDWLFRKWMGLEDCPIPMPAPIRWTLILGAIVTVPCIVWVGSLFL
jgi:hypothetical protein